MRVGKAARDTAVYQRFLVAVVAALCTHLVDISLLFVGAFCLLAALVQGCTIVRHILGGNLFQSIDCLVHSLQIVWYTGVFVLNI